MKLLRFFLRYSHRTVIVALLAGLISGTCNTALIALLNSSLRSEQLLSTRTILTFAALILLLPIARFTSEILLTRLGQGALFQLRTRLSRQILAAPLQYLEHIGSHRILATLTDDIPTITAAFPTIPAICINAAVLLGGLIYLGWLSPPLSVVMLCLLALGIAVYQYTVFRFMHHIRLAREDGDRLLSHFNALTEGTKELKLHYQRRTDFLARTLDSTAESYRRHYVQGMSLHIVASSWGQAFVFLIMGLMVFFSLRLIGAQPEVVTGYVIVLIYITAPLQVIMNLMPNIGRANVAMAKVERLGLALAANVEGEGGNPVLPDESRVELELAGVTYTYQRENDDIPFTLGPVDLTLSRGELLFITGGNGSGKTTFAKLVTGLYQPSLGSIHLNGLAVNEKNIEYYRQHFSAIFSDFYLFENFHGLDQSALNSKVQSYLERLELSHKVEFRDGKLSTLKLSQGQRKRLALLTAYLEDRPIYVFDEWAADQDIHFKDIFYYELLSELKARGKTVIVITHDDRYYHVADRLFKLESGHIAATVSHTAGAI